MNIIDDNKPNITPISSFGEFKLIDRLTKNFKCQNKQKSTRDKHITPGIEWY